MKYYAVIDTNVIVAALLTKNKDSATLQVINAVLDGTIIPLYHAANDEYPSPERARINAFGIAYRNVGYAFLSPVSA